MDGGLAQCPLLGEHCEAGMGRGNWIGDGELIHEEKANPNRAEEGAWTKLSGSSIPGGQDELEGKKTNGGDGRGLCRQSLSASKD